MLVNWQLRRNPVEQAGGRRWDAHTSAEEYELSKPGGWQGLAGRMTDTRWAPSLSEEKPARGEACGSRTVGRIRSYCVLEFTGSL